MIHGLSCPAVKTAVHRGQARERIRPGPPGTRGVEGTVHGGVFVHGVRPVPVGVPLPDQLPASKIMQALRERR